MKKEISIEKIRSDAEGVYKAGTFLCAEAVVYAIRQNIDPNMPKEMIAAATGFAVGVGGSRCMCSTVAAAVLCLGYFFGRTFPTTITDPQSQKTITLAYELQESFKSKNKALCCRVHLKGKDTERGEHVAQCAGFVGDMAAKTAEIVARELGLQVIA
ncbi:MAG: C-GCAxxG-C-C family protein [Oscillospiraceae bacterium]|nr:C-GCAxxG-C-C family protein [Oscillospiraceae bacterium]